MIKHERGLVYESPDGGNTIYSRQSGSTERTLIYKSPAVIFNERLCKWKEILKLAETTPSLEKAIEQVEFLYEIVKEEK